MKLSEIVFRVKIVQNSNTCFWKIYCSKAIKRGGEFTIHYASPDFKTRKGCIKNMEKFMKDNGFKYKVVG